jgi:hypothetical protein
LNSGETNEKNLPKFSFSKFNWHYFILTYVKFEAIFQTIVKFRSIWSHCQPGLSDCIFPNQKSQFG